VGGAVPSHSGTIPKLNQKGDKTMENRLVKITDWPAEAKLGGYRVQQVAEHLGVSVRWLEMHFKKRFGKCPHELFAEWREQEIARLAAAGKSGKEILDEVHLGHCSSLTRSLAHYGKPGLREIKRSSTRYLGGGTVRSAGENGKVGKPAGEIPHAKNAKFAKVKPAPDRPLNP